MGHPTTDHLLHGLATSRGAHCRAVSHRATAAGVELLSGGYLPDLSTAALLHDVGYRADLATTGFHPIDGAAYLRSQGFSDLVCHLVATHTGAELEAQERGIPSHAFAPYAIAITGDFAFDQIKRARSILTWADLTTSPNGQEVTVTDRLAEILARYVPGDPVHEYVTRYRSHLIALGSHPLASYQGPLP